jgi:hypothetical protein
MISVLEAFFAFLTFLMVVFLVRHYIFTFTVLRTLKTAKPALLLMAQGMNRPFPFLSLRETKKK